LIREGYCNLTYLPVLVDYKDKEGKVFGVAEQKELEKEVNITIVKSYHAIPTFSAKLSFEGINKTFKTLIERPEIKKIWLDKKVKVSFMIVFLLLERQSYGKVGITAQAWK